MPTATETTERKTGADRVKEFLGGRPAHNGAELVKALKLSGTPDGKLVAARAVLAAAKGKAVPTTDEVIAALEAADVSPGTLVKARAICETGGIRPPATDGPPVEDVLLGDAEPRAEPDETGGAEPARTTDGRRRSRRESGQ